MRIDLALKYLCLAKSRSLVKTLCEKKAVLINGKPAKASSTVHVDDSVTLHYPSRTLTLKLLDIPQRQQSKAMAPTFYDGVAEELDDD